MKKIYLILFLLIVCSCERDNIEAGVETKISGRTTEYLGDPVPNVKLKIGEFTDKFVTGGGGISVFKKWIDSTYTNQNGDYILNFKTTGNGTHYKLVVDNSPISEQKYWNIDGDPIELKDLGTNYTYNFNQILNLYPCDVTINLNNSLTIFPLRISHSSTYFEANSDLLLNTNTVIKRIYIGKDYSQTLDIFRIKSDGRTQKATYTFPKSEIKDLTTQSINVEETDFKDI